MHRFSDLLEFYAIPYRIVKGWPASFASTTSQETRSARINTFAVIRSLNDFNADNLKKTVSYTSRNYFFSRPWHDSQYQPNALRCEYPALGVREDTFQLNEPLDAGSSKRHTFHTLAFILTDQLPHRENNQIDPAASARTIEEVGNDLRLRMAQLLLVMGRFVYAKAYLVNVLQFEGWYDKAHLEQLKTDGVIDRYIVDDYLCSYVTGVTPAQGEVFYETGGDNLAVCIVTLTLETASCPLLPVIAYENPLESTPDSEVFEQHLQVP